MIKLTGKIQSVEPRAGRLLCTLDLPNHDELYLADTNTEYTIEIKKARKKRSLNANAYAWALCQKIADVLSKQGYITKEDVYRKAIRESSSAMYILVDEDYVSSVSWKWSSRGVGWSVEDMGGHPQGRVLAIYAGSSTFTTEEMSKLITHLVEEAKALGIETMTQEELDSLIAIWEPTDED